jgi:hypothetical protein
MRASFVELDAVDDVAAVARQLDALLLLVLDERGLANWPAMRPTLTTGCRAKGQHNGHLQEDAEEVADVVGLVLGKALGAIAPLEQEAPAFGNFGQLALQLAGLTGKNQRRKAYAFFFGGDYPLALQLGIINGLCVISIVLMRTQRNKTDHVVKQGFMRSFAWIIIFANFFLILNKDYRFIASLA